MTFSHNNLSDPNKMFAKRLNIIKKKYLGGCKYITSFKSLENY